WRSLFLHVAAARSRSIERSVGCNHAAPFFLRISKPSHFWPLQYRLANLPPVRRRAGLSQYVQGGLHGVVLRQGGGWTLRGPEISRFLAESLSITENHR